MNLERASLQFVFDKISAHFMSQRPWNSAGPWLAGLIVASAFCSGYVLMGVYRGVWQSHYPDLAAKWANNGRFALIGWYGTELTYEELSYASRVVEASRRFPAYDPYIKENDTPRQFVVDALTYLVMGAVHRLVGEINRTWIVLRFLACFSWFILIYFLMLRVGRSPSFAIFCGAAVVLFSYVMSLLFVDELRWGSPLRNLWVMASYGRTEGVLRLPRPGVTYAFLFLATLVTVKSVEKGGWFWPVLSGILGGALAYVRLDVWTSNCLALFFFALAWSWKERRLQWPLVTSCVIAAVVSLPYLYLLYPPDPDLLMRTGIAPRRQFDFYSWPYLAVCLLVWRHKKGATELALGAMCLATFFMVNHELVTGFPLNPEHWKFFGNIYVFLALAAFVPERFKQLERPWLAGAGALTLAALLQGIVYAGIHFPFQGLPKDYDDALVWLKRNTPEESVVFSLSPEVGALLPVYSHNKPVAALIIAVVSTYSTLDNFRRFVGGANLLGVDFDRLLNETFLKHTRMNDRRSVVAGGLRRGEIEKHDMYSYLEDTPLPAALELIAKARRDPWDVKPDYIWFGHLEREYAAKRPPFLAAKTWREVYRNPTVVLYASR